MRVSVYLRNLMNNSSMVPVPVTEFITPRASDVTLQLYVVNMGEDKEPLDLTGCDIDFIIRKYKHYADENDIVVHKHIDNGIYINDDHAVIGFLDIDITADDLNLPANKYYYSLMITTPYSEVLRQAMGRFALIP